MYFTEHLSPWVVTPERVTIVLDTVSFFLVTPEFLGRARLVILQRAVVRGGTVGLQKAENMQAAFRKVLPSSVETVARYLAVAAAIVLVVMQSERLRASPTWVAIFLFVLLAAMLVLLPWWSYFISHLYLRIVSVVLQGLAKKDALRFAVFILGTVLFLVARIIAWIYAHP